ncbi:MAG TPA: 50S ribosomal protein L3 N(5)-glutamine methyltransferase [Thiotrichales bacterium]|nr:50S ribosomal protein L3 N(5)-glutamine methyltransferase [Thiotrichales bacterium]
MNESLIETLQTVRDCIRWGVSRFSEHGLVFGHGTDNALDEAVFLVTRALHLPHDLPAAYLDARLTREERMEVIALLQRRFQERIPAAYLVREAWFAGLSFHVDERVLVPRSPIAELIREGYAPWIDPDRVHRVLDLCTGSGCIAIATAVWLPQARVDATDLSAEALEVARINVERHGVGDRVRLIQADLYPDDPGERYDVIVSNPPYVDEQTLAGLPPEYRHEPVMGLAGGEDGLQLVHRILAGAPDRLTDNGILVVEVGASAEALLAAYPQVPFLWPEFEQGGEGVFLLTAEEVRRHREAFQRKAGGCA